MAFLDGLTLRRKLTSISMLSSVTALLCSSLGFLFYDLHSFRESLAHRIRSEAEIIGFNSVSPILFNDSEAASATLNGLRKEPAVVAAAIFGLGEGPPLAGYSRDAGSVLPVAAPAGNGPAQRFSAEGLLVSEPILFEGKPIGTLLIRADLKELGELQVRYMGIMTLVLAGSLLLALVISRVVEKTISAPILELADTARSVSARKDYSVRARVSGRDEIGELVRTFNDMLDQIEAQNADLEQAHTDLEARVEARTRELAASNKELEAFSYSVSHDLRAPLRAIDGFSKALLEHGTANLDEKGRHYLQRVRAATQRMAELIDDLLSLARISRWELARRNIDVSEIAARAAADLANRNPGQGVRIEIQQGLSAQADPRLVTILLENLLGNAWKFSSRTPDPSVEVGRVDGAAPAFYVRDNGAGFDMAFADKLFGAVQRLHSEAEFEGTGIGLATVQRIVNRHSGRVWAEGALGKGATFYFTLESKI
jgi:signal transduction histidine kinase